MVFHTVLEENTLHKHVQGRTRVSVIPSVHTLSAEDTTTGSAGTVAAYSANKKVRFRYLKRPLWYVYTFFIARIFGLLLIIEVLFLLMYFMYSSTIPS